MTRDLPALECTALLLQQILSALQSIERRLETLAPAQPAPPCTALLAEISAAIGNEPFTLAALLDDDLSPALVAAVVESTGALDSSTNKRLGHLLSKAAKAHSVAGFRVARLDTAEGVTVWQVSGV